MSVISRRKVTKIIPHTQKIANISRICLHISKKSRTFAVGNVLAFSESGKFTVSKTLKHYMNHMAWIVVLLFGYQGIPEPRKAKQQDFNPAFL